MRDPLKHPLSKYLAKIGPVEEIALALDFEVQSGMESFGKVRTTTSWLLRPRLTATDILYLGDVVWLHKTTTTHRTNGIKTGTSYATTFYDAHGRSLSLQLRLAKTDALLASLATRIPWAYVGFDPRLQTAWKKERPKLLQAVADRKQQYLASQGVPEAPNALSANPTQTTA